MDVAALKKHLNQRRESLRQIEQRHEQRWRELRDYVQPFRGRFSGEKPDEYKPSMSKILDSAPVTALRMLSAGMQSGLTSPSRQWFKLTVHDAELASHQQAQQWCDEVHRRMMVIMASSDFYKSLHDLYDEVAVFGTAAMTILPDYDRVISCRTLTAGTYYLGKAAHERVDSFYRDLYMTAGEMAAEFGEENCSPGVQSALQSNRDLVFEVRHAVEPDTMGAGRFDYVSVYWEAGGDPDKMLRLSGYSDFPVMTPRWTVGESDIYGYGPASEALPDIKTLQAMKEDYLRGVKKQVSPPLVASRGVLEGGVKTMPNGITYVTDGLSAQVVPLYNVNLNLEALAATMEQYKADIRKSLYVDLFMMLSDQPDSKQMTAREVAERHEEKMLALGPVLERLEWELLIPAIDRIYTIMDEAGLVPEPPSVIQGEEIKIEFVSVLAQAQKMMGLSSIEQSVGFAGQIAAVDPSVLELLDLETIMRKYVEMIGAPADILREEQEVAALRAQRQSQQAQMMQQAQEQQAAQTAQSAAQGAKALADTPVQGAGGSALDALIGPLGVGAEQ